MTIRRWIADEVSGSHAALTGDHADHLVRVLRARVGQEFDIASGSAVFRGKIISLSQGRVEFELGRQIKSARAVRITLLISIFKFDRMEWAIEKCTELGVEKIIPVIARRSEAGLSTAAKKRAERWRRIALQAAEQSRRAAPPEISDPLKLKDALALAHGVRIVLSEVEQQTSLKCALTAQFGSEAAKKENPIVALAIGPVGGWTEDELETFGAQGWLSVSIGDTILRSETAVIAATAIVLSELN